MFERSTVHVRRAIFYARYEASFQSAGVITAGHILLGIIREGDSRSAAAGLLKGHATSLRSALDIPSPSGKELTNLMKDMPLDQNAKMALAYAVKEAQSDDSFYIYTDHLLRGVLCFPNEASDALQSISLDLAKVREASKLNRKKFPTKKTIYHRLFGSPYKAHSATLAKWLVALAVCVLTALLIRLLN